MSPYRIAEFLLNSLIFGYVAVFGVYLVLIINNPALKFVMLTGLAFAIGSAIVMSEKEES